MKKRKITRGPALGSLDQVTQWAEATDLSTVLPPTRRLSATSHPQPDRTVMISLRLPAGLLDDLKQYADQQDSSYQRLIKKWVTEGLARARTIRPAQPRSAQGTTPAPRDLAAIENLIHTRMMALEDELKGLLQD